MEARRGGAPVRGGNSLTVCKWNTDLTNAYFWINMGLMGMMGTGKTMCYSQRSQRSLRVRAYFQSFLCTHTLAHTFLLSRFLLVDSSDSHNLPCICYNCPLSPETGSIKSADPRLRLQLVQHFRADSPQMTSGAKEHATLTRRRSPRCCSHLFICVAVNKGNWGWLLVLPLEAIFQSLRGLSWVRQGVSPFLCTTARWACK